MSTRDIVLSYLRAVESHDPDQVAPWLHSEVIVVEHPNRISPAGKRYDLAALREASERGRALLASERYEVRAMLVDGERAVVQSEWAGTLRAAAGPWPAGHVLRAQLCSVFELRDGKVWRQEQYDCYLPDGG